MNQATVTQLGDVKAGVIQSDRHGTEANDPIPITLWAHGRPAAVFYYASRTDMTGSKIKYLQKIARLPLPADGASAKIKSAFDAYPITFSATLSSEDDERVMDDIKSESIMTADVNGDGTDELIVPRNFGAVDVYSDRKHLFGLKPASVDRKLYDYLIEDIHKYRLKESDGVLYAINRDPVGDISYFKEKELERHKSTANYTLIRIDKAEAASIVLQTHQSRIAEILAVGVRNLPGSEKADEIVACLKFEGDNDVYIVRFTPNGKMIGEARKAYVKIYDETSFRFLPHAGQMLMFNPYEHQLYFLALDKPTNWVRRVDLRKLLDADSDIHFMRAFEYQDDLIVLVRHKTAVYALDQESMFHAWKQGVLKPRKDRTILFEIQAESPLNEIVDVVPSQKADQFLVIQSRKSQVRKLADDQLIDAAKKFLRPDRLAFCEDELTIELDDHLRNEAKIYCKEKGISCPELKSVDDVKKNLPDVYKWFVRYTRAAFKRCLVTRLYFPIEKEGYTLKDIDEDDDYINKGEYKSWLKSSVIRGETVFALIDFKGNPIYKYSIENYSCEYKESELMQLSHARFQSSQEKGRAAMSLQKSGYGQAGEPAYYWIDW